MEMFFVSILPLILFVIADLYRGMKAGIVVAVSCSVGIFFYFWIKTGETSEFLVIETILIAILGGISLKMNNSQYFKFQPVVVGGILSLISLWYQLFDQPIMIKFLPLVKSMDPELAKQFASPQMMNMLGNISWILIINLLLHAAFVAWVAVKKGNVAWVMSRLVIYPMLLLSVILYSIGSAV